MSTKSTARPASGAGTPSARHVHSLLASPIGRLTLVAGDDGLLAILWEDDDPARVPLARGPAQPDHPVLARASRQLAEYFAGARTTFDLPLALDGQGTAFQRKVWRALLTIPFGETRSYGELAAQIGSPRAVRAVGAANGRNPLSIVAPCHRVVGATGKLIGFAGGLETKAYLLALEGRAAQAASVSEPRGVGAGAGTSPI